MASVVYLAEYSAFHIADVQLFTVGSDVGHWCIKLVSCTHGGVFFCYLLSSFFRTLLYLGSCLSCPSTMVDLADLVFTRSFKEQAVWWGNYVPNFLWQLYYFIKQNTLRVDSCTCLLAIQADFENKAFLLEWSVSKLWSPFLFIIFLFFSFFPSFLKSILEFTWRKIKILIWVLMKTLKFSQMLFLTALLFVVLLTIC